MGCMAQTICLYARLDVLFINDIWLVIVKRCVPNAVGVWVCLLGTGSTSCAEDPSGIM